MTTVALSLAVFFGLGFAASLISNSVPGSGPLRERLYFQYAVIGLFAVAMFAGGVLLLHQGATSSSHQRANRLVGGLALFTGGGGAGACMFALVQRRRRSRR